MGESLFQYLLGQVQLLKTAPKFCAAIFVSGLLVAWFAHSLLTQSQLASLDSLLKLRDAQLEDYREQLNGATPDQARKQIEMLANKISQMAPPRLTAAQKRALAAELGKEKGAITVGYDMAAPQLRGLFVDLIDTATSSGWSVNYSELLGIKNFPVSGVSLMVEDPNKLTPAETSLVRALQAAGLDFEMSVVNSDMKPPPVLILTQKVATE